MGKIDMRRMFLAVAGLVATTVLAQAADLPFKAPVAPVVPSNWTGFYIGGYAGGSWADGNFCPGVGQINGAGCNDFKISGFVGGVYVGYDYELPSRIVLGARVTAPVGSVSDTQASPLGFGAPGTTISAKFNWVFLATGTVGYDMGPWMPYIGGGLAVASVDATVTTPFASSTDSGQTQTGFNLLTGVKFAYTRNWAFGVQYNHMEFERVNYSFPAFFISQFPVKIHQDSLVGTVDYRF
jgi:outer membrane immunogenic protein